MLNRRSLFWGGVLVTVSTVQLAAGLIASGFWRNVGLWSGSVVMGIGVLLILVWVTEQARIAFRDASAIALIGSDLEFLREQIKLAHAIRGFSKGERRLFGDLISYIEIVGGEPSPMFLLRINSEGLTLPIDYCADFLDRSDDKFLCPISDFPDKTQGRRDAVLLTDYFIRRNLATRAAGRYSARWKSDGRQRAILLMGLHRIYPERF